MKCQLPGCSKGETSKNFAASFSTRESPVATDLAEVVAEKDPFRRRKWYTCGLNQR